MKKRFTEEKIIGYLNEAEAELRVKELCSRHGFSDARYYLHWRSKFCGMSMSDTKQLKELQGENSRLKNMLAESMLAIQLPALRYR